jgi:hypothetical protein
MIVRSGCSQASKEVNRLVARLLRYTLPQCATIGTATNNFGVWVPHGPQTNREKLQIVLEVKSVGRSITSGSSVGKATGRDGWLNMILRSFSWFPNAQIDISAICATYLLLDVFEPWLCATDEDFEALLRLNTFYSCAA